LRPLLPCCYSELHPSSYYFDPTTLSYDFTTIDLDKVVDDIIFLLLLNSSDNEQPKRYV
jgi:hypothetical protein